MRRLAVSVLILTFGLMVSRGGTASLIIVGEDGIIRQSPDDGSNWFPRNSGGGIQMLNDVDCVGNDKCWAAGYGGTIIHSDDSGVTWHEQTSGTTDPLSAIDFVNDRTGWVVGTNIILHTDDGGETWDPQWVPPPFESWRLEDVHFVDALVGWAVGGDGIVRHTVDGGENWSYQSIGDTTMQIRAVDFVDASTGWLVGNKGDVVYATTNAGATWFTQSASSGDALYDVDFVNHTLGWSVGGGGRLIKTSDGGLSWDEHRGQFTNEILNGVEFLNENHGFVVGRNGAAYETVDGGESWYPVQLGTSKRLMAISHYNSHPIGDINLDGVVNGLDVDLFVDLLLDGLYQPEADMNEDQVVNGLDVDPFVAAVVGGTQQIPEPSTLLLALIVLGVVGGWRKWKRAA